MKTNNENKDGALIVIIIIVLAFLSAEMVRKLPSIFGKHDLGESFLAVAMVIFYSLLTILLSGLYRLSWLIDKIAGKKSTKQKGA